MSRWEPTPEEKAAYRTEVEGMATSTLIRMINEPGYLAWERDVHNAEIDARIPSRDSAS